MITKVQLILVGVGNIIGKTKAEGLPTTILINPEKTN